VTAFYIILGLWLSLTIIGGIMSYFETQRVIAEKRRQEEIRRQQEEIRRLAEESRRRLHEDKYRQRPRATVRAHTLLTIEGANRLLTTYGGYRAAVKKTHPDCGGNAEAFRKVQEAKELLDKFKKGLI
jgi:predicted anti-sigma-YlaC factor YlaD